MTYCSLGTVDNWVPLSCSPRNANSHFLEPETQIVGPSAHLTIYQAFASEVIWSVLDGPLDSTQKKKKLLDPAPVRYEVLIPAFFRPAFRLGSLGGIGR
ncbi:hypothetical protein TNCT_212031 [Trichonephila clavata]|uniref:Uncharacterized protein n=1 Tax=Trichonephila clavata TaxID=2740835 RepID=A0A8X6GCX2_TRICU|nr:hypothetical protein TNCT_212031 [Trichonephila clavata]